jgi:hypothetical protein
MRTEIGIDVDAPAGTVFRLASDVTRWQRLLPHYLRSRRTARDAEGRSVVSFVAIRPVLTVRARPLGPPVIWRSRCWAEPAAADGLSRLRFVHLAGATRGMDVTWHIVPDPVDPARCRVRIEHDFRPRLPGWAGFVDRWFTRPIAGRTLATFKALAEAKGEAMNAPATYPTP